MRLKRVLEEGSFGGFPKARLAGKGYDKVAIFDLGWEGSFAGFGGGSHFAGANGGK